MTTTPQAALLSEADMLDCLREATHEIPTRIPPGWRKVMQAAEKRILAKLQATQEPVHAGELPPPPTLSDDERQWLHYNPNTSDIEEWVYGYAVAYARAALSARKPLTPLTPAQMEKGRDQIFSINNPFCPCDSKTFSKVAEWVERHHGIGLEVKP